MDTTNLNYNQSSRFNVKQINTVPISSKIKFNRHRAFKREALVKYSSIKTVDMPIIILLDDNFTTIVTAVEGGRRVCSNIRKSLYSMLGCNFSALTIVLFALIFGWGSPVTALQILIIKVACDGIPGFSLCVEKADPDIMQQPPVKKRSSIFAGGLISKIIQISIVFTFATLIPVWLGWHCYLGSGI